MSEPLLDDEALLATVSAANAYLALLSRLEAELQAGRAAAALSRIERSFVGVQFCYVPATMSPLIFCDAEPAALGEPEGGHERLTSASYEGSTLRQRKGAAGVTSPTLMDTPHASSTAPLGAVAARAIVRSQAAADPITWLGPNASGLALTAQSHFRSAVSTCLALRAARQALAARLWVPTCETLPADTLAGAVPRPPTPAD